MLDSRSMEEVITQLQSAEDIAGVEAILPSRLRGLFSRTDIAFLVGLRRDLHRHPELSWAETRTAARLEQALHHVGIKEIRRVAGTGIIARVPGLERDAPVVAIRGDIDALPIRENTGLAYASATDGVMHACGHDVHATWAVGAALLLQKNPGRGDVLIVLQPAEELGEGAQAIIGAGVLDGVAAIFGAHVDRRFALGEVVAQAGPLAASTDNFDVELTGASAHGARPHEGADAIVGASAVVMALQTVVSRRLDPALPGVVTVGRLHGGTADNVIPDTAVLSGTLRATDSASRALLLSELTRIAESTAQAYGLTARITFRQGTPPLVNPAVAADWARVAVETALGREALVPLGLTNMGGEDFAFYLERFPGCFLRIGAREPGGERIPAHSPRFYPAESSLFVGAAVLAEAARAAASTRPC